MIYRSEELVNSKKHYCLISFINCYLFIELAIFTTILQMKSSAEYLT
jgi:hypothetical protein